MNGCARRTAIVGLLLLVAAPAVAEEEDAKVKDGSRVSIEYTMKLSDGTVLDTNVGKEPLPIGIGAKETLPAVEEALMGLKVNESRSLTLSPEQGYGPIDETRMQEVGLDQIPEESRKQGALLVARDPQGGERTVRVREVKQSTIVIDLNHPLAGETLEFDFKVVSIE